MSKSINIGQPLFNNIEGHPFILGPQGPYRTKEEARIALISFYESIDDIPNGQECIIAGVRFVWRDNDLYENLAVRVINENETDLNSYITPGTYRFNSIRNNNFSNLPITDNNPNASITGELVVYNSVEGTTTHRSIIGQVLFLSNAEGYETKIYTRSANKTSKDGGITYEITWGNWQVCQGMKEVGVVDSYDSFIDNGMYSGVYNNNGIIETFILVSINNYVTKSQLGAPKSVSQLKYALNALNNESELSVRVGRGQEFKWGEWKHYCDKKNVTTQITSLQNQLNSLSKDINNKIDTKADKTEVEKLREETKEAINDIEPIIINGAVTNAPDEEDLTSNDDNLLQLKDRNHLNGVGYIILRQNKTVEEQLTQTNTIYEIRYDFNLNGKEITIPDNCILDFRGGSFKNGTLVGNKTKISGILVYSIFNNTIVKNFDLPHIDIRWTGAISDYNGTTGTCCADAIKNAVYNIQMNHVGTCLYVCGNYHISKTVQIPYLNIKGNHTIYRDLYTPQINYVQKSSSSIHIADGITAFDLIGFTNTSDYTYITIDNMLFYSGTTDYSDMSKKVSTLIYTNTGNAPSRPGWIVGCEIWGFNKVCHFSLSEGNTGYFNFTVDRSYMYANLFALYSETYKDDAAVFGNLMVKDSILEHGARIHLNTIFGSVTIDNCLLEGQSSDDYETIYIKGHIGGTVTITRNYFEVNNNKIIKLIGTNTNLEISKNYFYNCKGTIVIDGKANPHFSVYDNCGNLSGIKFDINYVKISRWDSKIVDASITDSTFLSSVDLNLVKVKFLCDTWGRGCRINSKPTLKPMEYPNTNSQYKIFSPNVYGFEHIDTFYSDELCTSITGLLVDKYKMATGGSYPQINGKQNDIVVFSFYSTGSGTLTVLNGTDYKVITSLYFKKGVNIFAYKLTTDMAKIGAYINKDGDTPIHTSALTIFVSNTDTDNLIQYNIINTELLLLKGATDYRPPYRKANQPFFDTTLNKMIWFTGEKWIDAAGVDV